MNIPKLSDLSQKFTLEKILIYILIFAVVLTAIVLGYLFFSHFTKSVKIISPNGKEELEIGKTYTIEWKAKGVDRIGIVLFHGENPKWIAQNQLAQAQKYEWKIEPGQAYGDNYWIVIFEYPWQKNSQIDYSDSAFSVVYPEDATCDKLSVDNEWAYLASDYPNIRRVFITGKGYSGNLGGLDEADKKCQEEAGKLGYEGKWTAFLGGDEDDVAIERLKRTSRKTEGVFVEAGSALTLIRGSTCHRLLGENFNEFLAKLSDLRIINDEKFTSDFIKNLDNLWLGRIETKSRKNCTPIDAVLRDQFKPLSEKYSYTTTCANWTNDRTFVQGYPVPPRTAKPKFPTCYTEQLKLTDAVAVAGLSSGLAGQGSQTIFRTDEGKNCSSLQRLLCVEQ